MADHGTEIGRNLRRLRKERGLSQAALARQTGVSQKVISAYERSYRLPPSTFIPRVAETLGTTPDMIYDSSERKTGGLRKNTLWKIVELLEKIPEKELEKISAMIENHLKRKRTNKKK